MRRQFFGFWGDEGEDDVEKDDIVFGLERVLSLKFALVEMVELSAKWPTFETSAFGDSLRVVVFKSLSSFFFHSSSS